MSETAQRETPHVGIFWLVQTSDGEARLLAVGCPVDQAEPYGDYLTYRPGHYETWAHWRRDRTLDPALRALVRAYEYEDCSASATAALRTPERFILELDRGLQCFGTAWVAEQEIATGLLTIFCRHTSASLLIQENADPDVQTDLESFFDEIAPEDGQRYVHRTDGLDDMPAHIRTALSQTQLAVPIASGRMVLGTWQGIYLFEHRCAPHRREIVLQLLG